MLAEPVNDGKVVVMDAQKYWEAHYGERERIWSGRVNVQLAEVLGEVTPGRALDLGCGEGGDAVWLAEKGWRVTAVDISATAIRRAAAEADARGIRDRIVFERHDLSDSFPEGTYDAISASFLHSTVRLERPDILRNAARAVAPGGLLVIVDHAAPPPFSTKVPHDHPFPRARGGARRARPAGPGVGTGTGGGRGQARDRFRMASRSPGRTT